MYKLNGKYFIDYNEKNVDSFIEAVGKIEKSQLKKKKKGKNFIEYADIPCAFDTETTSYIDSEGRKVSWVYAWMFGMNGHVICGRYLWQFKDLVNRLHKYYSTNYEKRIVCYIENMSFDFAFIRKYFEWNDIFCMDMNKPLYACCCEGVEFRCSYLLSGKSLETIGKDLIKYKVEKLVGNLDYNLVRHAKTGITKKEWDYNINDVRVVMAYIQELIESGEHLSSIVYTKTGFVRRYLREKFYNNENKRDMQRLMAKLQMTKEEYDLCRRAFAGGFTHANARWVDETIEDKENGIASFDFTSSYPAVMITYKFPMSRGFKVEIKSEKDFAYYINNKLCIFDIEIANLKLKKNVPDAILSRSKCFEFDSKGAIIDNGRVRECKYLKTSITNIDFQSLLKFYNFNFKVTEMICYEADYLPKPFLECVLDFYVGKTTLKGIKGKENEYQRKKEMLNSTYGMCVTDIVRALIEYCEDSETGYRLCNDSTSEEQIEKYNNKKDRTTFYPWGVFITAYARQNLYTGILEMGNDYIYSDTDSLKVVNWKNHFDYIKRYNDWVTKEIEKCLISRGIDKNLARPKNKKGEEKQIGIWDFENYDKENDRASWSKFKTLGAKRYIVLEDGDLQCTVAGISKKAMKEALEQYDDPFEAFEISLKVEAGKTGKNTHTYLNEEWEGEVVDYQGNICEVHTLSGVHLEAAGFEMKMAPDFLKTLQTLFYKYTE